MSLAGGVYANGEDTHYWWEHGPTAAFGSTTVPKDIGAGRGPVAIADTITGLAPGVDYHYALVAGNRFGTVSYAGADGFDLNITGGASGHPGRAGGTDGDHHDRA